MNERIQKLPKTSEIPKMTTITKNDEKSMKKQTDRVITKYGATLKKLSE